MKRKISRPKHYIPKLVKYGFDLQTRLLVLHTMLAGVEKELKTEASARPAEHISLQEKEGEGTKWIAPGDGCECHVFFPDDKLKWGLDPERSNYLTMRSLAGDHFKSLFREVTLYRPADPETFRDRLRNLLTPEAAAELLDLCVGEFEPQVHFHRKPRPLKKGKS
jgi:hypothetical protein